MHLGHYSQIYTRYNRGYAFYLSNKISYARRDALKVDFFDFEVESFEGVDGGHCDE